MKYTVAMLLMTITTVGQTQNLIKEKIAFYEEALNDVMEIIGQEEVKTKLKQVSDMAGNDSSSLNLARLGITYHEVALNLTFFNKTGAYSGYAEKSFTLLTNLGKRSDIDSELLIFIDTYRASALSLMSAETRKLKYLKQAFNLFETIVNKYANLSPRPEFMRGSVAENLPWLMFRKRKFAKQDFESIIIRYEQDNAYADQKIMSFTYWAWANAHQSKKDRAVALKYLNRSIALDPYYKSGRKKAEVLKEKLLKGD